MNIEGTTALVTGANRGIGQELARALVAQGATVYGGARNPDIVRLTDDELVSTAHGELQKVLGIACGPQVVGITRYERSIPQYNLGHFRRVQKIESLLGGFPRLHLIGNYLHGVSTGDCIKQADRVARELCERISNAPEG